MEEAMCTSQPTATSDSNQSAAASKATSHQVRPRDDGFPPIEESNSSYDLYWLHQLEIWATNRTIKPMGEIAEPQVEALRGEMLWCKLCHKIISSLEGEMSHAENWLCCLLPLAEELLKFSTFKEYAIARQEGWVGSQDQDFDNARAEFTKVLEFLQQVDLGDESAFLQANVYTHQRLANYHARIASSHRALVQRLRAELGLLAETAS